MTRFLVNWLLIVVAVALANYLLPDLVKYSSFANLAIFALVLGVLNAVVKPVVTVLTCPFTILTLGLFSLVVNAVMFWLAAAVTGDVIVSGFFGAFVAAIIVSVVNMLFGLAM